MTPDLLRKNSCKNIPRSTSANSILSIHQRTRGHRTTSAEPTFSPAEKPASKIYIRAKKRSSPWYLTLGSYEPALVTSSMFQPLFPFSDVLPRYSKRERSRVAAGMESRSHRPCTSRSSPSTQPPNLLSPSPSPSPPPSRRPVHPLTLRQIC